MRLTLQKKVDDAICLLQRVEPIALKYRDFGFIGAFSGGKDSQVVHSLLKISGVKHIVKYQWTTIDPPEVYHFIKTEYPDVIIEKPKETFWQICMRHGILPTQTRRFCCQELKETKDTHCVTITGVRAQESPRRSLRREIEIMTRRRHPDFIKGNLDEFNMYREHHTDCIQGKDKLIVNPIITWTETDVWDYLQYMNLPSCELYNRGYSRVGCLFCPMASRKSLHMMEKDYPKYRAAFVRLIGKLRQKRIESEGIDYYQSLTDEQIFNAWLNKISYKKVIAQQSQLQIEF